MGKAFIQESTLTSIASAIRTKKGGSDTYLPSEMPAAILSIPSGGGGEPDYFWVEDASGAANTLTISRGTAYAPILTFEYSYDKSTWTQVVVSTLAGVNISISANSKVYLRGDNPQWGINDSTFLKFNCSALFNIGGNIMTLSTKEGLSDTPYSYMFRSMFGSSRILSAKYLKLPTKTSDYCYRYMFENCSSLVEAPALPARKMTSYCYNYMFRGCTSLVTPPALPATELYTACYNSMFYGCSSLVTAPELPALYLWQNCYNSMFQNCTSLVNPPALPALYIPSNAYQNMFYGCSSLVTAPSLPANYISSSCYNSMFKSCTSLVNPPELPAQVLQSQCYYSMFEGCTSLTTAPLLPAPVLTSSCYQNMFLNCSSLTSVTALFVTTPSTSYCTNWLKGVAASGTFYKNDDATWTTTGDYAVPTGWTSGICTDSWWLSYKIPLTFTALEDNSTLTYTTRGTVSNTFSYSTDNGTTWSNWNGSAITVNTGAKILLKGSATNVNTSTSNYRTIGGTGKFNLSGNPLSLYSDFLSRNTLTQYCFYRLFQAATNIINASDMVLPRFTYSNCYYYMFYKCTNLLSVPNLPAHQINQGAYYSMCEGCTSLTTVPDLTIPFNTGSNLYMATYKGCTGIVNGPAIMIHILQSNFLHQTFSGCTSLKKIILKADTWEPTYAANWLQNVAATGDFYNLGGAVLPTGANGIPSGWTVHTEPPA